MFYVLTSRILPKWWLIMHDPKALCRIYPVCIMPSLTAFRRDPSCQRLSQIACLLNAKVWQKFLQTSHVGQPLASSKALGINPYLIFISCTQMVSHFYDLVTQYRKKKKSKSVSVFLQFLSRCSNSDILSWAKWGAWTFMAPVCVFPHGSFPIPLHCLLLQRPWLWLPFLLESTKECFHLRARKCLILDNS